MLPRLRRFFGFELHQAPRHRLRQSRRPRLEPLEDRIALTITVSPPGDQSAVEGALTTYNLGSFTDSNFTSGLWLVDVNWVDGKVDTLLTITKPGALPNTPHTFGDEGTYPVSVKVSSILSTSSSSRSGEVGSSSTV